MPLQVHVCNGLARPADGQRDMAKHYTSAADYAARRAVIFIVLWLRMRRRKTELSRRSKPDCVNRVVARSMH